ncbi:phosphoribosyltransferase-like protein [Ancylobacter amanitiformis]|uniref:PRTase-CE domain-containing protein n=1 Tax=Ancylobacter amanitiformis TaxID=217069 RepID=A0ABU0LV70_9HYPH|nr:hypothetical protein [Ancylobacter amanitiformis]MDQ0512568.1 hypothetical protein [Ancylobacter amanitiformis]
MDVEAQLLLKIRRLSEAVWDNRATGRDVDAWLKIFTSNSANETTDRVAMLNLLSNFTYFGVHEVRELLASLYHELYRQPLIQRIRQSLVDPLDIDAIEDSYAAHLKRTRFLGVGNPSESGPHLLYYLRQEADLPSDLFINHFELPGFAGVAGDVDHYVFIDDLCGTGCQACDYSSTVVDTLRRAAPKAQVSYFALIATTDGLRHVLAEGRYTTVACVMELGDDFRCFSERSRFWTGDGASDLKARAKDICLRHGRILYPPHPLGFGEAELAVGFSHNTPDDSLPIFWKRQSAVLPNFRPLFRRYGKLA